MMNYKNTNIFFIFLLIGFIQINGLQAQDKKTKKADKAFDDFAFAEASRLYQELIDKGNTSTEIYTKLADSYYYNANYPEAEQSYSGLMAAKDIEIDPEYYFRYAQSLNSIGKRAEASEVMKKYYSKSGKKDLSEDWTPSKFQANIKLQSDRYTISPVAINTSFADFGTAYYGEDKVIYASARDTGIVARRKHNWNEKAYFKLYSADITPDGGLSNSTLIKGDVNTKYHQSTPAVTKDGKTMYFTRNNYDGRKLKRDEISGINYLKIYVAQNINGEWKNVKELLSPINSEHFSSAHPALSPDESQLYFVSDRNNKFGNTDLYVVDIKKDGTVGGNLKKLGDEINTLGAESFPFLDASGVLYFSSDGHPGLGGLDVFAAAKDDNGIYHIVNLGNGVNSNSDDFSYVIRDESKTGYFSSNRSGNDDIYRFAQSKPPVFEFENQAIAKKIDEVPSGKTITNEDLTAMLKLSPIYFDFDGYKILEISKIELDKIVNIMKMRPAATLKVSSYTDSRGTDAYNMKLSENRAKATVNYIVEKGVESNRVHGEGFGDTHLINHCEKGVKCSNKEHELNRRSEFVITPNN